MRSATPAESHCAPDSGICVRAFFCPHQSAVIRDAVSTMLSDDPICRSAIEIGTYMNNAAAICACRALYAGPVARLRRTNQPYDPRSVFDLNLSNKPSRRAGRVNEQHQRVSANVRSAVQFGASRMTDAGENLKPARASQPSILGALGATERSWTTGSPACAGDDTLAHVRNRPRPRHDSLCRCQVSRFELQGHLRRLWTNPSQRRHGAL